MTMLVTLPRVLVIDDLYGRELVRGRNEDRANLCAQYLLDHLSHGDFGVSGQSSLRIKAPMAEVVFFRGQRPISAKVGDLVSNDIDATLNLVRRGWDGIGAGVPWSMVLLDLCFYTGRVTAESDARASGMPEGSPSDSRPEGYFGLKILAALGEHFPDLPVVIMSSMSRKEVSREFSAAGCLGFLPREDAGSAELLRDMLFRHGLIQDPTGTIVGRSLPLLLALRAARRASLSRRNVLLRGERGTGKELLAKYIGNTRGTGTPFVTVNSAVLSPTLFASELFGIERRVATGVEGRAGLISEAAGGDLFFDEIKDMSPEAQAGVLRVLEDRRVQPVGGRASSPLDVRFIAATNADVESLAALGQFRSDLLDRLREGGTAYLPPLRDRKSDIPLLLEQFVRQAESQNSSAMRREIDPGALARAMEHDWPGNIRELRNCIFKAVHDNPDVEHLMADHLTMPARPTVSMTTFNRQGVPPKDSLPGFVQGTDDVNQRPLDLPGQLPKLQAEHHREIGRLLKAALLATRRVTADHPGGRLLIHPAMKLVTGRTDLTASSAADLLKRLLKSDPHAPHDLLSDPLLHEAFDIACRLRPKGRSKGDE